MDIAIDIDFEADDAFRATIVAASKPLVLEPEEPAMAAPPSVPPSLAPTEPVVEAEPESRTVWWPLVLIGFCAVVCATIAFLKHPAIAPYTDPLTAQID